ncbi:MAG TPA: outer membrane protein assembly factor BamB [Steroidobacteraceae bacterium]|nr:outer membrane protein assembly factor BamB [Steroidobacteraceae bacterium]
MRHSVRWAGLLLIGVLAACSKDKAVDQPAKLTPLTATLKVQRIWNRTVADKHAVVLRLGLGVTLADNNHVYAAGHKGDVVQGDVTTGRILWHVRIKAPLSGGVGAYGDLVVVGSSDGRLFALNASDGKPRWNVRLNGEVLSAPAVTQRLVAVRTEDGKLRGLSPVDGHELWVQEQQVPRLSLRGTSSPVIAGDLVLCGFDNGKVMAVNANDGSVQWEATVTPPHGRTELERLADIDGNVLVSGQNVYAVGFQGRVAMLALDTGQVWWSREASSYRGLALGDDVLYVASSEGEIGAFNARTGAEIWRQSALLHRGLTAPAVMGDAIVTADYQGYVHWLDRASGALIARVRSGKVRVSTTPLVVGDIVVVITDRGEITGYRVTPLKGAPARKTAAGTPPATPAKTPPAAPAETAPAAPAETAPATSAETPPATPAETPAKPEQSR